MQRPIVMIARSALFALVLAGAGSAAAQEALTKRMELPAHEALLEQIGTNPEPAAFETDGCSGGMSDAWRLVADRFEGFAEVMETEPPWEQCCVTHDRAYHNIGGAASPAASYDARLHADRALRACVAQTGEDGREAYAQQYGMRPDQVEWAFQTVAGAMFLAVRFGGGPCTGLPWRWGFGYEQCSLLDGALKSQ